MKMKQVNDIKYLYIYFFLADYHNRTISAGATEIDCLQPPVRKCGRGFFNSQVFSLAPVHAVYPQSIR